MASINVSLRYFSRTARLFEIGQRQIIFIYF